MENYKNIIFWFGASGFSWLDFVIETYVLEVNNLTWKHQDDLSESQEKNKVQNFVSNQIFSQNDSFVISNSIKME